MAKRKRGRPPTKNIVFRRIRGRVVPVRVNPNKRILSDTERRVAWAGTAVAAGGASLASGALAGKLKTQASAMREQAKKMHAEGLAKARSSALSKGIKRQGKLFSETGQPLGNFKWKGRRTAKIDPKTLDKIRSVSRGALRRKSVFPLLMYAGGYGFGAVAGLAAAKTIGERRGPGRPKRGLSAGWWESTSSGATGAYIAKMSTQFSYDAAKMKGSWSANMMNKLGAVLKREEVIKAGKKAFRFKF